MIETPENLTGVAAAVVNGEPVEVEMPARLFKAEFSGCPSVTLCKERTDGLILVRTGGLDLRMRQPRFVLGIGCRKGITAGRIHEVADRVLEKAGFFPEDLSAVASADVKQEEAGLLEFARKMDLPLEFFPAEQLNAVVVPNPSEAAQRNLGIRSVSEASALLAAGPNARLYVEKQRCEDVTAAIAGGDHDS